MRHETWSLKKNCQKSYEFVTMGHVSGKCHILWNFEKCHVILTYELIPSKCYEKTTYLHFISVQLLRFHEQKTQLNPPRWMGPSSSFIIQPLCRIYVNVIWVPITFDRVVRLSTLKTRRIDLINTFPSRCYLVVPESHF